VRNDYYYYYYYYYYYLAESFMIQHHSHIITFDQTKIPFIPVLGSIERNTRQNGTPLVRVWRLRVHSHRRSRSPSSLFSFFPKQENQNPLLDLSGPLLLFLHPQLHAIPLRRAQLKRRRWRRAPAASPIHRVRLPLLLPPPPPQPQLHSPLSAPKPRRRVRLRRRVSLVLPPAQGPQWRRESLLRSPAGAHRRVRVLHGSGAGIAALRRRRQIGPRRGPRSSGDLAHPDWPLTVLGLGRAGL